MNRGGSQNRNHPSNRGSKAQNPQALHGINNRHTPSAGANRGGNRPQLTGSGSGGINLDNFTTSQKNINSAILEYLQKQGYSSTADVLNEDILQHTNGQLQRSFTQDSSQSIQQMGQAFNAGKRENFFTLWNRHVPIMLRQEDLISQKLEFYL